MSKLWGNGKQTNLITLSACTEWICNLLSQFLYSLLSPVNAEYVYSLLGHVTVISPLGKPWEILQFTRRNYPQFTEPLYQMVFFLVYLMVWSWFTELSKLKKNPIDLLKIILSGSFKKYFHDVSYWVNWKFSFSKL